MLCLASIHGGELPAIAEFAFRLRCNEDQAQDWLQTLETANLIDRNVSGTLAMHDWKEHQYASDNVTARVKKHRKKQHRNVTVTAPEAEQIQKQNRAEAEDAPLPPLLSQSEYPLTAAAIRKHFDQLRRHHHVRRFLRVLTDDFHIPTATPSTHHQSRRKL